MKLADRLQAESDRQLKLITQITERDSCAIYASMLINDDDIDAVQFIERAAVACDELEQLEPQSTPRHAAAAALLRGLKSSAATLQSKGST